MGLPVIELSNRFERTEEITPSADGANQTYVIVETDVKGRFDRVLECLQLEHCGRDHTPLFRAC